MHVWVDPEFMRMTRAPKPRTVPAGAQGQDMYIYIWIHTYLNRSIDPYMDMHVCM